MEDQPKSKYWKFMGALLLIVFGTVFMYVAIKVWSAENQVQKAKELVDALEREIKESYDRAMTDTYGGKTPQETLSLYIEAVEKGDYVLASKYFIGDYQERELSRLQSASQGQIAEWSSLLREDLNSEGSYSAEKDTFAIRSPILARLKLYPNGIWKIIEI